MVWSHWSLELPSNTLARCGKRYSDRLFAVFPISFIFLPFPLPIPFSPQPLLHHILVALIFTPFYHRCATGLCALQPLVEFFLRTACLWYYATCCLCSGLQLYPPVSYQCPAACLGIAITSRCAYMMFMHSCLSLKNEEGLLPPCYD